MGMFSWELSDTGRSLSSLGGGKAKMLDDKGNVWVEEDYEGYGCFEGKDFYVLLAEMNGLTAEDTQGLREKAIDLYYSDKEFKCPKLVTLGCVIAYEDLDNPKDCPRQGC